MFGGHSPASWSFALLIIMNSLYRGHSMYPWPFGGSSLATTSHKCEEDNDFCICQSAYLICSYREIVFLPELSIDKSFKTIDFSGNKLTSIKRDKFVEVSSVEELILSKNFISEIEVRAFANFKNLEILNLSRNMIKKLPRYVFYGLQNLKSLDLSLNYLHNLQGFIFTSTVNLKRLILGYNPMGNSLESTIDVFYNLEKLEYVDLTNTSLKMLPKRLFSNNLQLHELGLSRNLLTQVPSDALTDLQLEFLDLSYNKILVLESFAFHGLYSLKRLIISGNDQLEEIQKYAFHDLNKLEILYCENNRLTSIHPRAFYCRQNDTTPHLLKWIYLAQNRLHSLDENLLDWKNVEEFDLQNNPWICDCHMKWTASLNLTKYTEEFKCAYPRKLNNMQLVKLEAEQLICAIPSHTYRVTMAILLGVGILITMSASGYLLYRFHHKRCRCCSVCHPSDSPGYSKVIVSKDKVELEWDDSDLGIA